jgi:tRNA(Ile)-lysidine synthase
MASSRKPRSAEVAAALERAFASRAWRGKRILVGLSGGADSVVLLHALGELAPRRGLKLGALHVHHGLSRNADAWASFCRRLCRDWRVPLAVRRVRVGAKRGRGLEAAAREARYAAFRSSRAEAVVLAHHLDDQAETVLLNLLRGTGVRGARGMAQRSRLGEKTLLRPLLEVPREAILRYAARHGLEFVQDESNADEALARAFLRRRIAPLLAERYPRWRESLARAARHFSAREERGAALLRAFLAERGLRAPSEARLAEMLRQLASARRDAQPALRHGAVELRRYRGNVALVPARAAAGPFRPLAWRGEARMALPALDGTLHFRRALGRGIDAETLARGAVTVRVRTGGERLRLAPDRPRRTLKNLFQEHGVPPWERGRLPLIYCGERLAWAAGLGTDAGMQAAPDAPGILPVWRRRRAATPRAARS